MFARKGLFGCGRGQWFLNGMRFTRSTVLLGRKTTANLSFHNASRKEKFLQRALFSQPPSVAIFFSLRLAHGIAQDKVNPFSRSTKLLCTLCWELKAREWSGTFPLPGEGSGDGRQTQKKGSCHC